MPPKKRKNCSQEEIKGLLADLLDSSSMHNGERVLASGAVGQAAKKFKMSERNVRKLWNKALENRKTNGVYAVPNKIQENSGRNKMYNREEVMEALEAVPASSRATMRSTALALGVSVRFVHSLVRDEKVIHPHNNAIKPYLTEQNKLFRLMYASDRLNRETGNQLKGQSDEFERRLRPDHDLVVSKSFESGTVKILNEESESLTPEEQQACQCLLRDKWKHLYPDADKNTEPDDVPSSGTSPRSFRRKKKQKRSSQILNSQYIGDVSWISATTVVVEQLFSKCSLVMTADRRKMFPRLFESIVCLRQNHEWWDLQLIQDVLSGKWDDQLQAVYDGYGEEDDEDDDEDDAPLSEVEDTSFDW